MHFPYGTGLIAGGKAGRRSAVPIWPGKRGDMGKTLYSCKKGHGVIPRAPEGIWQKIMALGEEIFQI